MFDKEGAQPAAPVLRWLEGDTGLANFRPHPHIPHIHATINFLHSHSCETEATTLAAVKVPPSTSVHTLDATWAVPPKRAAQATIPSSSAVIEADGTIALSTY